MGIRMSKWMSTQERHIVEPIKLKGYEEKIIDGISYDTPTRFTGADVCSEEGWIGPQETWNGNARRQKTRRTYESYQSG